MGKDRLCSVRGCDETAVRAVSLQELKIAGFLPPLELEERQTKVYLCKQHYKEYKKLSKKEKRLEKWRQGLFK